MSNPERIILAMTGASGAQYSLHLLDCLMQEEREVHFLISKATQLVMATEAGMALLVKPQVMQVFPTEYCGAAAGQIRVFGQNDQMALPASGPNTPNAMVIYPCPTGILSAVATGAYSNLVERVADVALKKRRSLVLVPREAPFSSIHPENVLKLSNLGVVVLPATSGFYRQPQSVEDLVNFVVARILNTLGIPQDTLPCWGGQYLVSDGQSTTAGPDGAIGRLRHRVHPGYSQVRGTGGLRRHPAGPVQSVWRLLSNGTLWRGGAGSSGTRSAGQRAARHPVAAVLAGYRHRP